MKSTWIGGLATLLSTFCFLSISFLSIFFSETHIRRDEISIKYLRIKSRRISLVNYIFMYLKMQHAFASRTCFSLNVYALYVFNSNFIGANALETIAGFFLCCWFWSEFRSFYHKIILLGSVSMQPRKKDNTKNNTPHWLASICWMICDLSCRSQKRECKCAKMQHESFVINIHGSISPTNIYAAYVFIDFQLYLFFLSSNW